MTTAEVVVDGEVVGLILIDFAVALPAPWLRGETRSEYIYDSPEMALKMAGTGI
jgi:hypothetical protein